MPKNSLTYGKLDEICRRLAGNITRQDIFDTIRQAYINDAVMNMYRVLDGLDDPFYNQPVILTVAADQEFLTTEITGIDATELTITRSSGEFIAGSILHVVLDAAGVVAGNFTARITEGGAVATFALISGTAIDLGANNAKVWVTRSLSETSIDVSNLSFKEFNYLGDDMGTTTPGQKNRMFVGTTDPNVFYDHGNDYQMRKEVLWYQRGDTILLSGGSEANVLGTVAGEIKGKPALYTDDTIDNAIDIPPENNQILINDIVQRFMIDRGKREAIPPEVAKSVKDFYAAADAEAKKKAEKENK